MAKSKNFFQGIIIISLGLTTIFLSCKNTKPETASEINKDTVEEVIENYGDGSISRKYYRKGGNIVGLMEDYYPDGSVMGRRYFENGQQAGKTILYFSSGKIKEVQYYENGLKNGGDTVFYESGQPEFTLSYKDEKRHGYLRKWNPEGKLIYEAKFENDEVVEVLGNKVETQKEQQ